MRGGGAVGDGVDLAVRRALRGPMLPVPGRVRFDRLVQYLDNARSRVCAIPESDAVLARQARKRDADSTPRRPIGMAGQCPQPGRLRDWLLGSDACDTPHSASRLLARGLAEGEL